MNEELVKCTGLCRSFEAVQALRGVDLSLTSGKIVGLLGPNGSGKTTLIKILNGLLQPTAGEARVAGLLPGVETKAITSYLPDRGYFPDWMRVGDMIDMFSDFYADFDRAKAEEMCRVLGLEAGRRIKTLSKGTREKMQLMLVMSRRARLYLLDEPIAGVDPAAREFILRTILTNYNENGTVLIDGKGRLSLSAVDDAPDPRCGTGARRGGLPPAGTGRSAREHRQHPRAHRRQRGRAVPQYVPRAGHGEWRGIQCSVN